MNINDIDVNLLIQTFTEKIAQLTNELVVKETIIKQLTTQLNQHLIIKPKEDKNER